MPCSEWNRICRNRNGLRRLISLCPQSAVWKPCVVVMGSRWEFYPRRSGHLPMEHPSATLIRFGDVVLGQQPRAACGKRSPINPSFAGGDLLHRRHKDEVPRNQLELIIVLGSVRVDHLKGLQGRREEPSAPTPHLERHWA